MGYKKTDEHIHMYEESSVEGKTEVYLQELCSVKKYTHGIKSRKRVTPR